jgi:copper resistance protein C
VRKSLIALAATLAVLAQGSPAWAHAQLLSADPAKDATLAEAPTAVTLTFSERLNPDLATIVVSDAAGRRIPASAPAVDAAIATVTLTEPPANGIHTIAYRVVSVDGHTVQGSYTVTIADPARSAASLAPTAGAPASAVAPPTDSGGIPAGVLGALFALGVILPALALLLYWVRRQRAAAHS